MEVGAESSPVHLMSDTQVGLIMSVQASHPGTKMLGQCSLHMMQGPAVLCRGGCQRGVWGLFLGGCRGVGRTAGSSGLGGDAGVVGSGEVLTAGWGRGSLGKSIRKGHFPCGSLCVLGGMDMLLSLEKCCLSRCLPGPACTVNLPDLQIVIFSCFSPQIFKIEHHCGEDAGAHSFTRTQGAAAPCYSFQDFRLSCGCT